MCGIVGGMSVTSFQRLQDAMPSMMQAIANRGPDDEGAWSDERAGVILGHRRLSIVDLSPLGHQPMRSASGRYILVYNGEIYNHLEIRGALEVAGRAPQWRGHSDTETLVACIEAWGLDETLRQTVGMFAMALWDIEKNELSLARDRFGEKPLYYGWQGGTLLFASDLSALVAYPDFERRLDREAIALFLRHNYVPTPYSIWKGVRKLPAGTSLTFLRGQSDWPSPIPFWSLPDVIAAGKQSPLELSEDEAISALEERLSNAIRGQMVADVPLGALLSGGVDSSTVVALMQAQSPRPVKTFSIGFREKKFDESGHAEAVARYLGTDHTTLFMSTAEVRDAVPAMIHVYSEPFADSSQVPTSVVMRLARKHVTVALSGDGGDELFGGYHRYSMAMKLWSVISRVPRVARIKWISAVLRLQPARLERLVESFPRRTGTLHIEDRLHKLAQRLESVRDFDDFYLSLLTEWTHTPDLVKIAGDGHKALLHRRADWPASENRVDRMMALDALTYLPDDIMVKVDRSAMAVSLETRAPFLDHRLAEFVWRLPPHQRTSLRQPKRLLRKVLYRHVPKELIERPKMGFGVPLDEWLCGPLRDWAEDLLQQSKLEQDGLLNTNEIRTAWQAHLSGERRFGYRLWTVLILQAWLRSTQWIA